jgi:hypothetical protein
MRRVVWLVISSVLLSPPHSAAQQLGQRIRLLATDVTPPHWVVGDLLAQDGDSLQLHVAGQAQPIAIARSSLKRLEVSRDRSAPCSPVLGSVSAWAPWSGSSHN